jgi:eukaryotic-like serine/threonine-protein kinase
LRVVREGDEIDGKYQIIRSLGAGGMGVVVAARHKQLGEKVAIKFLHPHMIEDELAVSRFVREARAAARIKSEYIARVYDVGTLPAGGPYMVMEFLEGGDLTAWIKQKSPVPVAQAVDFVLQACVGVAEAHMLGIVHRDLKPSNLFCVRRADGQVTIKVLDFGISKMSDRDAQAGEMALTHTSAVMGSPLYMSPEQMRSARDVTARTDIWALGVILYELLASVPPFGGKSVTELAVNVATQRPPPLANVRPDAPPGLEAVILRCLEKDARARYGNVGELALALADFAPARSRPLVDRIAAMTGGAILPAVPVPSRPPSSEAAPFYITPQFGGRTAHRTGSGGAGMASLFMRLLAFVIVLGIGYAVYHLVGEVAKAIPSSE